MPKDDQNEYPITIHREHRNIAPYPIPGRSGSGTLYLGENNYGVVSQAYSGDREVPENDYPYIGRAENTQEESPSTRRPLSREQHHADSVTPRPQPPEELSVTRSVRLAPSLSYRQLFQQRLQKYRLPSTFHCDVSGPGHDQIWIGSFWIKGTLLGRSGPERSKGAAKEGAAKHALAWLNRNHYY